MGHNGYMRGVCTGGGIIYQHAELILKAISLMFTFNIDPPPLL
jgi:hypothetical protein